MLNGIRYGGYYNDKGLWVQTKFCLIPCLACNCQPPNGKYYDEAYDESRICHGGSTMTEDKNLPLS